MLACVRGYERETHSISTRLLNRISLRYRLGAEEEFQRVPQGICLGCRHLLHPQFATHLPPPTNPLGLTQSPVAHSQTFYLTSSSTRLQRVPSPPTPLGQLRRHRHYQRRRQWVFGQQSDDDGAATAAAATTDNGERRRVESTTTESAATLGAASRQPQSQQQRPRQPGPPSCIVVADDDDDW